MGLIKTGSNFGIQGKVGDRVYYTSNGKTVVRQISAAEYNSKTVQQILQRVITKTVVNNYSALKDIVNHSFQGVKKGADSMAYFNKINAHYLRDRAAEIVNAGTSLDSFIQFSKLGQKKFVPAALYISEGTLTQVHPSITPFTSAGSAIACLDCPENTYASLANQYNLKRGDQVTLLTVEKDAYGEYLFKYERIIMDPRDGGDVAPMSTPLIVSNAINKPSRRNEGYFHYLAYDETAHQIRWKGINGDVAAVAVIISRKSGSDWFRSNAKFLLNEDVIGDDKVSLLAAIGAAQAGTTEVYIADDDSLYLNNAGVGGSEGEAESSESDTPVDTTPVVSSVEINNVQQNVSGGSVSVATEYANVGIEILGQNLTAEMFSGSVEGQSSATVNVQAAEDGNSVAIDVAAFTKPATVKINKSGALWFTLTVTEPSSGGDGTDES